MAKRINMRIMLRRLFAAVGVFEGVGASRTKPGSVSALIAKYYRSAEWANLSVVKESPRREKRKSAGESSVCD